MIKSLPSGVAVSTSSTRCRLRSPSFCIPTANTHRLCLSTISLNLVTAFWLQCPALSGLRPGCRNSVQGQYVHSVIVTTVTVARIVSVLWQQVVHARHLLTHHKENTAQPEVVPGSALGEAAHTHVHSTRASHRCL